MKPGTAAFRSGASEEGLAGKEGVAGRGGEEGTGFGAYVRGRREALHLRDRSMSLRQVARRIGVEPAFLSKVERGLTPPPSEAKVVALAGALGEDPDLLLAMAGKVSSELAAIIRARPKLFGELLRTLKGQPDHAILRIVREVTDGDW